MGGGLVVAALVLSLAPAGAAGAAPGSAPAGPAGAGTQAVTGRTVTLVTGDRVTVATDGRTSIRPGDGRAAVRFVTTRTGGHLRVVPTDALPLLRAGRLDGRLFDVTALLAYGYDRRADLPLIVSYDGGQAAAARASTAGTGARVVRDLPAVRGLAVRAARGTAFWAGLTDGTGTGRAGTLDAGVRKVWLDGLRTLTLDVSVPQIGAPAAWRAGYDGTGVTVAVLDTGVDAAHPDLAGQVKAARNFTEGFEDDLDHAGHGTHVASTIAGTGAASNGRYRGVAPGAKLLSGKVCVNDGCAESWILAGMQWAAEQGAKAANMSLGGDDTPEQDLLEQAVETLTARYGTLFVIAAGNSGPQPGTVSSPGSADSALTVGAVDKTDEIAPFSSRGPRVGDAALKPDITGPGVSIIAARSTAAGGGPGNYYASGSGTSMATPHVVGATAILAQRRPDWTPARLKATLMGSAAPHPSLAPFAQGAGRVDVARAIDQVVSADPPSVSFGRQAWPHADDTPVTKTVTYRNDGPAAVTLALAATALGPDGRPAPAGMFRLSATTLTVPAGGKAAVTLTADTRVGSTDGYVQGRLTATAGGTVVQTPFAVDREVESYDLTLAQTNRDGQTPDIHDTLLFRTDRAGFFRAFGTGPTATVRLPKGTYMVASLQVDFPAEPEAVPTITFAVQPRLRFAANQTVTVDGRRGGPISVTLPRPGVSQVFGQVTATAAASEGPLSIGVASDTFEGIHSLEVGPRRDVDGFAAQVGSTWARLNPDGSPDGSPVAYNLAWFTEGHMISGAAHRVRDRGLATVTARHAVQEPGAVGWKGAWAIPRGPFTFLDSIPLVLALPGTRTEYFNTDGNARWVSEFYEVSPDGEPYAAALQQPRTYRAGRAYVEDWNRAVFGPALGRPTDPELIPVRRGDTIHAFVPMHGDGAGRSGLALYEAARTALFRDGVKVGEVADQAADFTVPPQAAGYRLEVDVTRLAANRFSTRVSGVWTFRSRHVSGTAPVRLPLSTITFSPALDDRNTAPAGRAFVVPVTVAAQPGSAAGALRRLGVEVSYDDGATWRAAPVGWQGGTRVARVTHPGGEGFVSLRATAGDDRGNTVTQTIIHAYRFA